MSLPAEIDHDRAKSAARAVANAKERGDFKSYRTVVLSAGITIRQIGLPQFTAFGISKDEGHRRILSDLFGWLQRSVATRHIASRLSFDEDKLNFMKAFLQRSSSDIAALEVESQHFLLWLKRLAEGVEKERKREEQPQQAGSPADAPPSPGHGAA